ncbi:aminotransferase class IV [Parafrankia colletiae]|uniref:Aminotransferase class IV n=1 Tax=Parafrankia colletiae TaxID=573497 RepID=A0A1S1R9Z4_9ACTN|nr:aminotransferase class IV [Parafrankia colletiae]MCK9900708.1 aminotransferase class IV [Frankia sp. Cpl3]OHV42335.1 aminotransferase class IV [Parafrankia colletiae]
MNAVEPPPYIEVDGRPADGTGLRDLALSNDGHLTTMQVRAGRVRGLAPHLSRLDHANQELYGAPLDAGLVRDRIRHALAVAPAATAPPTVAAPAEAGQAAGVPARSVDATVRVVVFPTGPGAVSVLVSVGRPAEPASAPLRLCSLRYQRPFAHIKHLGTFGQLHGSRLARRRGFDDALLVTTDGRVCETTVATIGFVAAPARGRTAGPATVIWPEAPSLCGVTMTLLDEQLRGTALASPPASGTGPPTVAGTRREPVRLAEVGGFHTVFVANARGLAAVERIDDTLVPPDPEVMAGLRRLYAAVPWDEI